MALFWMLAGSMVAIALLFLLRPLLSKPPATDDTERARAASVELFQEQLDKLQTDQVVGAISPDQAAEARTELEEQLARTTDLPADSGLATGRGPALILASILCAGIPAASFLIYHIHGSPAAIVHEGRELAAPGVSQQPPDIAKMVAGLEQRLQQTPNDGEGWRMLGRSYFVLEQYPQAAEAYQKAETLLGADAGWPELPDLLVESAEAHAFAAGNRLAGPPLQRLERALELSPEHPKALWLGGFAALQASNAQLALERWQKLLGKLPAQSREKQTLETLIAGISEQATLPPDPTAGAGSANQPDQPDQPDMARDGPRLRVHVSLAPELADKLNGDEIVFVIASNPQGPRMPVAVVRRLAAELPMTVYLDDSAAMLPNATLSHAPQITLRARVSASGNPIAASGDLQGELPAITPRDFDTSDATVDRPGRTLKVVIDTVVL